ncbi:hypothetical protein BJ165DRAFT_1403650 [Panaeolus papilionaceus]|nr:hypothetical protein BJ165DRAFT_1403650 [Panaeolus papilionaceus]
MNLSIAIFKSSAQVSPNISLKPTTYRKLKYLPNPHPCLRTKHDVSSSLTVRSTPSTELKAAPSGKEHTSAKGAQYCVGYEIPPNEDSESSKELIVNSNIELDTPAELQTSTDLESAPESECIRDAHSVYVHWVCELDGPGATHGTREEVLAKVHLSEYRFGLIDMRWVMLGWILMFKLTFSDSDSRGGVSGLGGRFKLRLFEDGGDMFQEWHEPLIVKIEVEGWDG